MPVKYQHIAIKMVILAILCGLPPMVAPPAYANWFFHHKKEQATDRLNDSSVINSINEPAIPTIDTHKTSRRLLPINFINSGNLKNNQISKQAAHAQPKNSGPAFLDNQRQNDSTNNNSYAAISHAIPLKTTSTYTTTNIRIGIGLNLKTAKIVVLDGAQLIDNTDGEILVNLPAQSEWLMSAQDNRLVLQPAKDYYSNLQQLAKKFDNNAAIQTVNFNPNAAAQNLRYKNNPIASSRPMWSAPLATAAYTIQPVTSKTGGPGLLALNDRVYRGSFVITPVGQPNNKHVDTDLVSANFNIINSLDLEDYLLSVVPSEMPSLWPAEALKAQAIAARSYAIANLGKNGSKGFDLKDNTEDQMYLGVRSETDQTNDAVVTTKGLVLKYEGKPICAYFHSSSGGSTEGAEHVWHRSVPYLKAVTDFDQEAPLYNWTKNYSIAQTESGLPKDIGQVLSINILTKGPSGRATYMLVNGSNASRIITGEAARKYFSLPSTNFNVTPAETTYIFVGKGFGHGLGLSQWGAKSLAKHGYNAAQILCYYYNGISIDY